MKGLVLKYPVLVLILLVVVFVSIGIIVYFYQQSERPSNEISHPSNVKYVCIQFNNSIIDFQDFQDVLYGFLTGQCNNFVAKTEQKITLSDIERIVETIVPSIEVIQISKCKLPSVNSHTVYVNFTRIEKDQNLYLTRREIDNSDVLICG